VISCSTPSNSGENQQVAATSLAATTADTMNSIHGRKRLRRRVMDEG